LEKGNVENAHETGGKGEKRVAVGQKQLPTNL
jgi:hypothetical protein